jgi:hypothetical protein
MSRSRIQPNHGRRLIVEDSDQHVVIQLLARHEADWETPDSRLPFVHAAGGIERALDEAEIAAKARATYHRVGVLIDADLDASGQWVRLRDRWRRAGIEVPDKVPPDGWVADQPDGRRFGAWIMPDNIVAGAIEVFLAQLVPVGDGRWSYACEAVDHARTLGAPLRDADVDKARIATWLAWQEQPGRPPGLAIRARAFSHDAPAALAFVAWFRRLYDAP